MLSGYGLLNSTLALMNYLVATTIFLELVVVTEWLELLETKDRTVAKTAKMIVSVRLRTHELWLPKVWTKLVRQHRRNAHHSFLLLDFCYVLFGFWAHFGAMAPTMISAVEVWISWIMVLHFWWSSSPSSSSQRKISSCAWSVVLVELRVFNIVDVWWSLELRSPCCSSIASSCLVSLSNSLLMIFIRLDVLFQFFEKFLNGPWFFTG
jgi:hypothetical protein